MARRGRGGRRAQLQRNEQEHEQHLCKPCNCLFPTKAKLITHKENQRKNGSKDHIFCKFCHLDFETEAGERTHIQDFHPQEQQLECPGCKHGPFTRLASLIEHVEFGECARINIQTLNSVRDQMLNMVKDKGLVQEKTMIHSFLYYAGPSILSKALLRPNHDKPAPSFKLKEEEFPALGEEVQESPVGKAQEEEAETDSWGWPTTNDAKPYPTGDETNLWLNPPSMCDDYACGNKTESESEHLSAWLERAAKIDEEESIHHPSHPDFNVARYASEYSDTYACPEPGCTKSFKKAQQLEGHLWGPAHSDNFYYCPYCTRQYKSLSSITAHVESNNTRCKIRKTEAFPAYVYYLTAGMVDVDDCRFADGTAVYRISEHAPEVFSERGKTLTIEHVQVWEEQKPRWEEPGFW